MKIAHVLVCARCVSHEGEFLPAVDTEKYMAAARAHGAELQSDKFCHAALSLDSEEKRPRGALLTDGTDKIFSKWGHKWTHRSCGWGRMWDRK